MKKIIMVLAVALTTLSSFATEKEIVSSKVLNAFNTEFAGAKEVVWSSGRNYYKASFVYNNQHINAFYHTDGELMGLTRYISSLDLPINLQVDLKKEYSNYWITDLFEVSNTDGTSYYITMEDADSKIVLKSNGGGDWIVYQKTTKA